MKMQITFRSGAQVEVDVEEFETGKSPMGGMIHRLNWTTPDDWTQKLHSVDIEQIAAIVAVKP